MIRVWSGVVRSLHALLAVSVLAAWFSGHWPGPGFEVLHHGSGYLAGAVVVLRMAWGFIGERRARFAQFVRGPGATLAYARELRAAREPRHLGHNPLGAWMVLALLATVAALSISGMLYTGGWLWGYAWLETLHAALAWLLMTLVIAHWMGVAFTSWRHRENLLTAILSGCKRAAAEGDVD